MMTETLTEPPYPQGADLSRIARYAPSERLRRLVELCILRHLLGELISRHGFSISVDDGGEQMALTRSTDVEAIIDAATAAGWATLVAHRGDSKGCVGRVFLAFGHRGYDLIADNSLSMEQYVKPTMEYAQRIEKWV